VVEQRGMDEARFLGFCAHVHFSAPAFDHAVPPAGPF
jgi:hypothetical protein